VGVDFLPLSILRNLRWPLGTRLFGVYVNILFVICYFTIFVHNLNNQLSHLL